MCLRLTNTLSCVIMNGIDKRGVGMSKHKFKVGDKVYHFNFDSYDRGNVSHEDPSVWVVEGTVTFARKYPNGSISYEISVKGEEEAYKRTGGWWVTEDNLFSSISEVYDSVIESAEETVKAAQDHLDFLTKAKDKFLEEEENG